MSRPDRARGRRRSSRRRPIPRRGRGRRPTRTSPKRAGRALQVPQRAQVGPAVSGGVEGDQREPRGHRGHLDGPSEQLDRLAIRDQRVATAARARRRPRRSSDGDRSTPVSRGRCRCGRDRRVRHAAALERVADQRLEAEAAEHGQRPLVCRAGSTSRSASSHDALLARGRRASAPAPGPSAATARFRPARSASTASTVGRVGGQRAGGGRSQGSWVSVLPGGIDGGRWSRMIQSPPWPTGLRSCATARGGARGACFATPPGDRRSEPPPHPVGGKLEITFACNLRCGFCYTDSPRQHAAADRGAERRGVARRSPTS